jgi:hypothetical protein
MVASDIVSCIGGFFYPASLGTCSLNGGVSLIESNVNGHLSLPTKDNPEEQWPPEKPARQGTPSVPEGIHHKNVQRYHLLTS